MLITLFIFEIMIAVLTIFTTHMVEHKIGGIQNSLGIYRSKRAYRTKAEVAFIEKVIEEYEYLGQDSDEEPDLECIIRRNLQHEYIGAFPYISVRNIAVKLPCLMWGILMLQGMIIVVNKIRVGSAFILVTASLILTILMALYTIIKGLDEKKEVLIDESMHYVRNIYPTRQKKETVQEEVPLTDGKVVKLERNRKKEVDPFLKIVSDSEGKEETEAPKAEQLGKEQATHPLSVKDIVDILEHL